jgi:hypothetical protein
MDGSELETRLRNAGIDVYDVESVDPLALSYITAHPGAQVDHSEMGRLLNELLDLARADEWEPTRVEVTVLRFEDEVMGTWHADPAWFEGLLEYRLSETEFSTRVLETLDGESEA